MPNIIKKVLNLYKLPRNTEYQVVPTAILLKSTNDLRKLRIKLRKRLKLIEKELEARGVN